ncbi:MAG: RDD family protein, partial [Elusimicrobiaceae bacterium]|nr:RDD family protein [Elusimicrobiaceae bacterium]
MEETNNTQQNSIPAVSVISAPTTNTDEPNYAGFFWRAAAVFIDLWFYSLLTFIVLFCLSRVHFSPTINSENIENVVTSLVIVLIIACKTFLFDFCLNGKTPGRLLCNLSVTDLEGKPLIGWKRILRSFISFISSTYVLFALPIILP